MAVLKYKDSSGNTKTAKSIKVNLLENLDDKVMISAENATLQAKSDVDKSINGKSKGLVTVNNKFNVIVNELTGKNYNYTIDSSGSIVSYGTDFQAFAQSDNTFIPVYSDAEVESKPIIFFCGKGYSIVKSEDNIYHYFQCEVPDTYTKKNWGVIVAIGDEDDSEMVVNSEKVYKMNVPNGATQRNYNMSYYLTLQYSDWKAYWDGHEILKSRAYMTVEKDGVEEVIYSKIIRIQL